MEDVNELKVERQESRLSHPRIERLSLECSDMIPLTPKSSFKKIKSLTHQIYDYLEFRDVEQVCKSTGDTLLNDTKQTEGQMLLIMDLQKQNSELKQENIRLSEELKSVRKDSELQLFRKQQEIEHNNLEIVNLRKDKEEFNYREQLMISRHNRKVDELTQALADARAAATTTTHEKNPCYCMSEEHETQYNEFQNEICCLKLHIEQCNSEAARAAIMMELYKEKADSLQTLLNETLHSLEEISHDIYDLDNLRLPEIDFLPQILSDPGKNIDFQNELKALKSLSYSNPVIKESFLDATYDYEHCNDYFEPFRAIWDGQSMAMKQLLDGLEEELGKLKTEDSFKIYEISKDHCSDVYESALDTLIKEETAETVLEKFACTLIQFLIENDVLEENEVAPNDINVVYVLADKYLSLLDMYVSAQKELETQMCNLELKALQAQATAMQELETTLFNNTVASTETTCIDSDWSQTESEITLANQKVDLTLTRDPLEITRLMATPATATLPPITPTTHRKPLTPSVNSSSVNRTQQTARSVFHSPSAIIKRRLSASLDLRRALDEKNIECQTLKTAIEQLKSDKAALNDEIQKMSRHHADTILQLQARNEELLRETSQIHDKLTVETINLKPELEHSVRSMMSLSNLLTTFLECIMEKCVAINEEKIKRTEECEERLSREITNMTNHKADVEEKLHSTLTDKQNELNLLLNENVALSTKLKELELEIQKIQGEVEILSSKNKELNDQLELLSVENNQLQDTLSQCETKFDVKYADLQDKLDKVIAEKKNNEVSLNEQKAHLSMKLTEIEVEMKELRENCESMFVKNNELNSQLERLLEDKRLLQNSLSECEKKFENDRSDLQKEADNALNNEVLLKKEKADLLTKLSQMEEEIKKADGMSTKNNELNNKIEHLLAGKDHLEKTLTELNEKFKNDRSELQEKLETLMKEKQMSELSLNEEKADLCIQLQTLQKEMKEIRSEIDSVSAKNNELNGELERLLAENNHLLSSLADYEKKYEDGRSELQEKFENMLLEKQNHELSINKEKTDLSTKLEALQKELSEIRSESGTMSEKNNELNDQLEHLLAENNQLLNTLSQCEKKYEEDQTALQEKLDNALAEKQNNKVSANLLNEENAGLCKKLETLEREIRETRSELENASAENNKLNEKLEGLSRENNQLQDRLLAVEKNLHEKGENETEVEHLRGKVFTLNEKIEMLTTENKSLTCALQENAIKVENMQTQLVTDRNILQSKLDEVIQRENEICNEKKIIQSSLNSLEIVHKSCEEEMVSLQQENDRLLNIVRDLVDEVEDIRRETDAQIVKLISSNDSLGEEVSVLNANEILFLKEQEQFNKKWKEEISQLKMELCELENKFSESETLAKGFSERIKELLLANALLESENKRLTDSLELSHNIIVATRVTQNEAVDAAEKLASELEIVYERNKVLKDEIEILEKHKQSMVKTAVSNLEVTVDKLQSDIDRLSEDKRQLEDALHLANTHNTRFEKELLSIKEELSVSKASIDQLNAQLEEMIRQKNKALSRNDQLEQELKLLGTKHLKELDNLLVQMTKDNEESVKKETELKREILDKCNERDSFKRHVDSLNEEVATLTSTLSLKQEKLEECERNYVMSTKEVNHLENLIKKLQDDCVKVSSDKALVEKQVGSLKEQVQHEMEERDNKISNLEIRMRELDDSNCALRELFSDVQRTLGLPEMAFAHASANSAGHSRFRIARDGMLAGINTLTEQSERLKVEIERLTTEKLQFELKTTDLEKFGKNQAEQMHVLTTRLAALEANERNHQQQTEQQQPSRATASSKTTGTRKSASENFSSRRMDRLEELNGVLSDTLTQIATHLHVANAGKLVNTLRGGESGRKAIVDAARTAAEVAANVETLRSQVTYLDEENQQMAETMRTLFEERNLLEMRLMELSKQPAVVDIKTVCSQCSELQARIEDYQREVRELKATQAQNRLHIGKLEEETEIQRVKIQELKGSLEQKAQTIVRMSTPSKMDEQHLAVLCNAEGGSVRLMELRDKVRNLTKTNDTLKEVCRTRAHEIKQLKAELLRLKAVSSSALEANSANTFNSNQMNSPIRERGYNLRTRHDVAANYKKAIRAHAEGRENIV